MPQRRQPLDRKLPARHGQTRREKRREHDDRSGEAETRRDRDAGGTRSSQTSKQLAKFVFSQLMQLVVQRYLASREVSSTQEETPSFKPDADVRFPQNSSDSLKQTDMEKHFIASLNRVLRELQNTQDLLLRTMYAPAGHASCPVHQHVLVQGSNLQAAIARTSAEVRDLQRLLGFEDAGHGCAAGN